MKDPFVTPQKHARGLGSTGGGLEHWWQQRWTSILLIPLFIWVGYRMLGIVGADYAAAYAWVQRPSNAIPLVAVIAIGAWHGILGLQIVFEDYVGNKVALFTTLLVVKLIAYTAAAVGIFATLKIAFGV